MFFPRRQLKHTPTLYNLPYEDIQLPIFTQNKQPEIIHGWWIPSKQQDAPTMLYFHHNGINIGANVSQALQFHELGYSLFLIDYRGYGQSSGPFPNEKSVYQDAQTAWNYLTQKRNINPEDIIIYGHSIGGAVAVDLAAKHPEGGALILQSAFTSMKDVTKRLGIYYLLPIELLLTQRFESLAKMPSVQMPVLIISGTSDIQISVSMAKQLHQAAPEIKELIIIEGGGHDNHLSLQHKQKVKQFTEDIL